MEKGEFLLGSLLNGSLGLFKRGNDLARRGDVYSSQPGRLSD